VALGQRAAGVTRDEDPDAHERDEQQAADDQQRLTAAEVAGEAVAVVLRHRRRLGRPRRGKRAERAAAALGGRGGRGEQREDEGDDECATEHAGAQGTTRERR
jgi:hypothetical protein